MKNVYFCMLINNQSTINHNIPFYTAKSYHSTILVQYEGLGVSRLRHFLTPIVYHFFWTHIKTIFYQFGVRAKSSNNKPFAAARMKVT